MIQGFTDNFDEIRSVLKAYKPHISLLTPERLPGVRCRAGLAPWREGMEGAGHVYSIATLNGLARYLSGVPGRKNLIWFSAALNLLPLDLKPHLSKSKARFSWRARKAVDRRNQVVNGLCGRSIPDRPLSPVLIEEEHQTAVLFALGQVAIYPIDPRGPISDDRPLAKRDEYLQSVATATGGRAFYETNDVQGAIASAIEDGSNYYSLSYTPNKASLDNSFRTIQVMVHNPDYVLSYRNGYYSEDPSATPYSRAKDTKAAESSMTSNYSRMHLALLRGTPELSQVLFTVHVQPVGKTTEHALAADNEVRRNLKGPFRLYRIDILVNLRTLAFSSSKDSGFESRLESGAYLYDNAKLVNKTYAKGAIHSKADPHQSGVAEPRYGEYHHEISVPVKGTYYLRIALHDLQGDGIGSIEVPIAELKGASFRSTVRASIGGTSVYPAFAARKQAMEMKEYGKHGKP